MRAVRFGSYSIAATSAGTPVFVREVDDAVALLVPTTGPARDAAVVVAAAVEVLDLDEQTLRLALRDR
ncbi:MAG: hypothetical protein U0414_04970 [Polyangiaceae bacterium]